LYRYVKSERHTGEHFGDWVNRVGFASIKAHQEHYKGLPAAAAAPAHVAAPVHHEPAAAAAPAHHEPALHEPAHAAPVPAGRLPRVMIEREAFEHLKHYAEKHNTSLTEAASHAILKLGEQ
jgi:sulfite reductase (ferredoxin)